MSCNHASLNFHVKHGRWSFAALATILMLLSACGSHLYHYVRKGETLYSISFEYGQDYRDVASWNGIRQPYTVHPTQRLRVYPLPPGMLPPSLPPITSRPSKETRPPVRTFPLEPPQSARRDTAPQQRPEISQTGGSLAWVWPADGKLLRTFSERDNSRKGLDIGGIRGTPVRAASSGQVVYSGDGLARYGNMIIIKHNDSFLSAYAHNWKLLVQEGQEVRAGQTIAEMGDSGTEEVMLHFEIRLNGKPVDPLRYLPGRS